MKINMIIPILRNHMERYVGFSARDAYKLLHQSFMGPSHSIPNKEIARKYFMDEFNRIEPDDDVPLLETLQPDFSILRVNLAPYKKRKLDAEKLLETYFKSAEIYVPKFDLFLACWKELVKMSEEGKIDLRYDDVRAIDKLASENEYPPIYHSDLYRKINNPAYRVVLLSVLKEFLPQVSSEISIPET
jgi:hypothetical protein